MHRFSLADVTPELVTRRRTCLLLLWLVVVGLGSSVMGSVLFATGPNLLKLILLLMFAALFGQVVFGSLLAITGFALWWRGGDPVRITNTLPFNQLPTTLSPTAIVMPIYHENVEEVFHALRIMVESLARTGRANMFHFFVLSDSKDPAFYLAEERAWLELCGAVNGFGRIFYRRRRLPLNHKSGNIADFCRRWGKGYQYMIVLDADSIMTGPTFFRLLELMDHNPQVGIIQTAPRLVRGESLIQRVFQFSNHVYGPLFQTGANYWQLGGSAFWGHNAIVRLQPFLHYCALPELPKNALFGRHFLSHDTIEAALMRKAHYDVWLAYDLGGSYEVAPPNLLALLQRDRRWCWGNLQHIWFLFARGLRSSSRMHIITGIMTYLSAPLWLAFLLLGALVKVNLLPGAPQQPQPDTGLIYTAGGLFAFVMALLFLPKLLGIIRLTHDGSILAAYGGRQKLILSAVGEAIFSMTLAPILMIFHAQFVISTLMGTTMGWSNQLRSGEPAWRALIDAHANHTLLAWIWGILTAWWQPALLPWLSPVLLPLLLAIPFSQLTGSVSAGKIARQYGWFLIPEETQPTRELLELVQPIEPLLRLPTLPNGEKQDAGLAQVLLDPYTNALHIALLRPHRRKSAQTRCYLQRLGQRLLAQGPVSLTGLEKKSLLWDPDSLIWMHRELWRRPRLHGFWRHAWRQCSASWRSSPPRCQSGPAYSVIKTACCPRRHQ